jgi:hypothetical protein
MDRELYKTIWNHFYNDNRVMLETMEESDVCYAFLEWLERHKINVLLNYHGYFHKLKQQVPFEEKLKKAKKAVADRRRAIDADRKLARDSEKQHWENLSTHNERFNDYGEDY